MFLNLDHHRDVFGNLDHREYSYGKYSQIFIVDEVKFGEFDLLNAK